MTRTHFHGPGKDLDGLCVVCLMVARGAELDELAEQWQKLEADGHDELQKWFEWDGTRTLIREAVVKGISDVLPQAGPIDLCWDHLGGLTVPKAAGDGRRLVVPPGLRRGKG